MKNILSPTCSTMLEMPHNELMKLPKVKLIQLIKHMAYVSSEFESTLPTLTKPKLLQIIHEEETYFTLWIRNNNYLLIQK